eukprot:1347817-Prymnesium_polylepis.1
MVNPIVAPNAAAFNTLGHVGFYRGGEIVESEPRRYVRQIQCIWIQQRDSTSVQIHQIQQKGVAAAATAHTGVIQQRYSSGTADTADTANTADTTPDTANQSPSCIAV